MLMASFHGEPEMIQYLCAILRRNISPHAYRNPFTMNWSPYVTCTVQWQRFHTAHVKRPLWNSTIDPAPRLAPTINIALARLASQHVRAQIEWSQF